MSEAWVVWSNAQTKHPQIAKKVLGMQDMVHSTREQYIDENAGSVTCFVSTESGVDAFATSTTNADNSTVERLLTPLEAMRTFRAQIDTPTAELRPDHFDRQTALVHGPLTIEAIAAGNLKGIRKWVWERLGGTLYAQKAADALNALHAQPFTEHATMRLSQARRNRYSIDDIADLLNQLHEEDRLVIKSSETDNIKLVCSIGVREA
ncbi:hypothetical protein ACORG1_31885 (plasmid) [Mycobacterium sp. TJFP1]